MASFDFPEMREIRAELEELKTLVKNFALQGKATVSVADIAKYEGVNRTALHKGGNQRYLLPRFGESGYPDGPARWDVEEFVSWRRIPVEERKSQYLRRNLEAFQGDRQAARERAAR